MKKTVIFGASGFGREVKVLLDQINQIGNQYNFIGFYDDGIDIGTQVHGQSVLGGLDSLASLDEEIHVIIAIASPQIRRKVRTRLFKENFKFPTLIHPSVLVDVASVQIGIGTIICAGCILTCDIEIEDFVIFNLYCTVGHDSIIKSFCSFMPSVNISGDVLIHENVYIGTGVKVINQIEIGENTIVGAGAVVSKSLTKNCTAVGIPAKPIKFNE